MNPSSEVIEGIGVSPGIAIGKAYLVEQGRIPIPHHTIEDESGVDRECQKFQDAVNKAEEDLEEIKARILPVIKEHARVLEVHQMILRDPLIFGETLRLIRQERLNAQWALQRSLLKAYELFESVEDEYVRSRTTDIQAVGERILRNLAGKEENLFNSIRERVILVAHDLSPADTAQLLLEKTLGFVTDMGGRTSHTSILARSLNIPAVVGTERATQAIPSGCLVILDGSAGTVIIDPSDEEIGSYYERQIQLEEYQKSITRTAHLPARTRDGHLVRVEANIELLEEVVAVKDNGAEGIGLYRTEFFLINRKNFPDENTLYSNYRELAELMAPHWVTMRTLDFGADKLGAWYPKMEETNPALGLRSIRLCLHYRDLFKTQLRAILRASASTKNVRLMFPLISGVAELLEARGVLREVREELRRERIAYDEDMPVGVMIEVPSAVAVSDLLAREVDFFSIGTNDLIQYSIGIDRANEHVAYLYEPLHPGVLRLIKMAVEAGHRAGIPVSLCGEMAGESFYVPILLGLQLDCLSMNPQSVPRVKNLISRSLLKDCRRFVKRILESSTAKEINELLQEMMLKNFPEEYRLFDPRALSPRILSKRRRVPQRL
ncbi:MAG TPA: phosphoenolpyruvate--protein phosphotransferase [Syntrophobacteraceae bacterium]|nr:phosphoenolpyruvate--protein phosphotransferase [Syntrophobacteraceae bacterium]